MITLDAVPNDPDGTAETHRAPDLVLVLDRGQLLEGHDALLDGVQVGAEGHDALLIHEGVARVDFVDERGDEGAAVLVLVGLGRGLVAEQLSQRRLDVHGGVDLLLDRLLLAGEDVQHLELELLDPLGLLQDLRLLLLPLQVGLGAREQLRDALEGGGGRVLVVVVRILAAVRLLRHLGILRILMEHICRERLL